MDAAERSAFAATRASGCGGRGPRGGPRTGARAASPPSPRRRPPDEVARDRRPRRGPRARRSVVRPEQGGVPRRPRHRHLRGHAARRPASRLRILKGRNPEPRPPGRRLDRLRQRDRARAPDAAVARVALHRVASLSARRARQPRIPSRQGPPDPRDAVEGERVRDGRRHLGDRSRPRDRNRRGFRLL